MKSIILSANLKYLFFAALSLLTPIKHLLVLVGFLIIIDTVLGVWSSKKRKVKITSNKLASVVSKMLVYQGVIIVAYAVDTLILGGIVAMFIQVPLFVTKVAALMVIINEGYSIDENIRAINKNKGTWFYFKKSIGVAQVLKREVDKIKKDE
jgi:hypothetical protein